jgi:glycine betaine/proline transport system substrate-binding protein
VKAFNINNEEMGAMVADVDLEGRTVEEVVAEWMANNKDRWSTWIGG